jgi:hypothetical protein
MTIIGNLIYLCRRRRSGRRNLNAFYLQCDRTRARYDGLPIPSTFRYKSHSTHTHTHVFRHLSERLDRLCVTYMPCLMSDDGEDADNKIDTISTSANLLQRICTTNTREWHIAKNIGIFILSQLIGMYHCTYTLTHTYMCTGLLLYIVVALRAPTETATMGTAAACATIVITAGIRYVEYYKDKMIIKGILLLPLIRCIVLCALPVMCTNYLRTFLIIMLIVGGIHGPAANIHSNATQVLTSMQCVHGLVTRDTQRVCVCQCVSVIAAYL